MKQIFVSQPNRVSPDERSGVEKFMRLLKAYGLNPRSIGVTDMASRSPLEEVIELMRICSGAIILGIPQIRIQTGTLRGEEIREPFSLGTEWNHIEAALAYSLDMPVLVIHDENVVRGIFDRGAANAFIYSVDFSSDSWPFDDEIIDALGSWAKRLDTEQTDLEL